MFAILTLLFVSAFSGATPGLQCKDLFSKISLEQKRAIEEKAAARSKVWRQMGQIDSSWDLPLAQVPELLLTLRAAQVEAQRREFVVDGALQEKLHLVFGAKYSIPQNPTEMRFFFANAVRSFSSRIVWEWKALEISKITGVNYSGEVLITAQRIMDSFLGSGPWPFERAPIEEIQRYFAERKWESFPWAEAMLIVEQYHASGETFYHFHTWYEGRADLPRVSFDVLERIMLAVSGRTAPVNCCNMNCLFNCPNNLQYLKSKDSLK